MRHLVTKVINREPVETVTLSGDGMAIAFEIADAAFGPGTLNIWSKTPGHIIVAPHKVGTTIAPPAPDCTGTFWVIETLR